LPYQKICIFRTGALGDVILTLPVIQNLHLACPGADIHLFGKPHLLSLGQTDGIAIHDMDRAVWASLFASGAHFSQEIVDQFQNTDLVISYLPDPDGLFTQNLRHLGALHIIVHPPKPQSPTHAIDHLLKPLFDLNIATPDLQPRIALSQIDQMDLDHFHTDSPTLLIHPGSGGKTKCWFPEYFARVADDLILQTGCSVLFSSGPADGELAHQIIDLMDESANALTEMPLPKFALCMKRCTAYLGNDSGPSHLAAALDLPSVILFGPTDPRIWAPRGPFVQIIQSPDQDMSTIPPAKVTEALIALISKS
jgi:heptosyltransferase-3